MKIGISTVSLFKTCETEDAFSIIKDACADTCEVYLGTFYEYRPEFAKKFAERAAGLEVNSVHVNPLNFESQLFFRGGGNGATGFTGLTRFCAPHNFSARKIIPFTEL